MIAASLCSGIGAPEVATPDWNWIWHAEIEAFPAAVMAARHPGNQNLGNILARDFLDRALRIGIPDVLVAGTPCQAFSKAGLRAGLNDARGNLTLRALEILEGLTDAARHAGRPGPIFLWENVPGVLSDRTNAFGCLLGGLVGNDAALVPGRGQRWTNAGLVVGPQRVVAWRILDAQYFGLAQRRERVFLVACPRDGADPAEVLLEFAGVRGNYPPRSGQGKSVAETLAARTNAGGGLGTDFELSGGLQAHIGYRITGNQGAYETGDNLIGVLRGISDYGDGLPCLRATGGRQDFESETFIAHTLRGEGYNAGEDGTGRGTPLVFSIMPMNSGKDYKARESDVAQPLMASGPVGGNQGGDYIVQPVIAFSSKDYGGDVSSDISPTLRSMGHANSHANGGGQVAVADRIQHGVRRLTPRECERLQGFPDDYTLIPWRGGMSADGPRYKALGNSMAVPVIAWIGRRIAFATKKDV